MVEIDLLCVPAILLVAMHPNDYVSHQRAAFSSMENTITSDRWIELETIILSEIT